MIRLRYLLERGCAHPVFGPILLAVLVLMLAMLFFHVAEDGHGTATDFGAVCIALAAFLGSLVLEGLAGNRRGSHFATGTGRGPPRLSDVRLPRFVTVSRRPQSLPLRR